MKIATADRGQIIHFAGFQHLSPALRDGAPAFAGGSPDASLRRCGWETFFAALDQRHLALAFDPDQPGSAELLPRERTKALGHHGITLGMAFGHAAHFVRALLSSPKEP